MKFLFSLLFISISFALSAKSPIFQRYDVKSGLPSSYIYDVAQDEHGVIWIATDKGVSQFDGTRFKNYTVKDGLPNNDVFGLVKDKEGRIWLNTHERLAYIEDGIIKLQNDNIRLDLHEHIMDNEGNHFVSDLSRGNNYLWIGLDSLHDIGIANHQILSYSSTNDFAYSEIEVNKFQVNFISNRKSSIVKLDPAYLPGKGFKAQWIGNKYYVTSSQGVQIIENEKVEIVTYKDVGFKKPFTEIYFVKDGMFIRNKDQFVYFDSQNRLYEGYDFLNKHEIHRIFSDNEGNLWLSTDNGLFFVSSLSIKSESYSLGPELSTRSETPTKIIKDADGTILISTYEGNIYKYENESLKLLFETGQEGLRDMAQDGYGRLWLATDQFGCFRLRNLKNIDDPRYIYSLKDMDQGRTKTQKAVFKATVKALKMGPDNRLYVASAEGVSRIEFLPDHYSITKLDSLRSYSVAQDLFGYIWIGRTSGISRYKDGKLIDLGPNHPISNLSVTDIDVDASNGLWIGSDGYGLFHDRGNVLCQIEQLDGYIIKSLFIDDKSKIWAATNRGVVSIESSYTSDTDCSYTLEYFSSSHGLASNEVNDILIDDGYLIAATKNGVSRIPINYKSDSKYNPPLVIQSVEINGTEKEINQEYKLSYDQNDLRIDFAALSYQSLGQINYEYQMTNIDSTWQSTTERFREYQTLLPGNYQFKIRAKDFNGNLIGDEKQINFDIKKAWWNRWWFKLIYLGLALFLFFGFSQYRIFQARKQAEKENEVNKKFAELELQAIRSQMNPHFLFNALHSIQDYIFNNDSREANRYISSFAKLMRKILDASKEKYIYLDQELEMLSLYLDLEKLRFQEQFDYKIEVDPKLDEMSTEIPTMIIQPFVENAINHGLIHRKNNGLLVIRIVEEMDKLKIEIEDNGIGMERALEIKMKSDLKHDSKGMKMITSRLELMNEMYNTRIIHFVRASNPDNKEFPGTKITIEIPSI